MVVGVVIIVLLIAMVTGDGDGGRGSAAWLCAFTSVIIPRCIKGFRAWIFSDLSKSNEGEL